MTDTHEDDATANILQEGAKVLQGAAVLQDACSNIGIEWRRDEEANRLFNLTVGTTDQPIDVTIQHARDFSARLEALINAHHNE